MELFVATVDYGKVCPEISHVREAMRNLCLEMWVQLGLEPIVLQVDGPDSQRQRRIEAEEQARERFYISTADDCFPDVATFNPTRAADFLRTYGQFAILAAKPLNEIINPWTPNNHTPFVNEEVEEHYSVGHISFCRKGAMLDWPRMGNSPGYDSIQCEYLRSHGWRVGFLRNMGMVHLGKGLSSCWRDLPTPVLVQ